MDYLVGVGVADPAEQPWIRKRSLEGVILLNQPLGKTRRIGVEDLETASLELLERLFTSDQPERGASFRAGLGENQRSVREVERGEADLAGHFGSGGYPAETARNHEVNDEEEIVLELQDDALSHSPHTENQFPIRRADGWID